MAGVPLPLFFVNGQGKVLVEVRSNQAGNADITAHAELTAIREMSGRLSQDEFADCTLHSSAEPCAIYWANVGRVVFGLSEGRLRTLRNVSMRTAALTMACAEIRATGGHTTGVIGPVLEG